MAAAITSTERYCFKFELDKCTNKKCRFIHQLMNEQQKKESGFDKNRPDMKSNNEDMKFKGKRDTRNNTLLDFSLLFFLSVLSIASDVLSLGVHYHASD